MEQTLTLRDSAKGALKNKSLQLIHDQVAFAAVSHGVHKLERTEQSFFGRAALWYGQQEREILLALAGGDEDSEGIHP